MYHKLHIRKDYIEGFNAISKGDIGGLEIGLLRLHRNSYSDVSLSNEVAVILLSGKVTVTIGEIKYEKIGGRESVFDGKATALFIPNNHKFTIQPESKAEIVIAKAACINSGDPVLITQDMVKAKTVGNGNWERKVFDIIDADVPSKRLLIGETINPPGNWSSYPPHKHDTTRPPKEYALQEVYFYKVSPEQGFGIQRIYSEEKGLDEAFVIKNNDAVLIPYGYHPVVAAPGYKLYYLWILLGENKDYALFDDTNHSWVKNV